MNNQTGPEDTGQAGNTQTGTISEKLSQRFRSRPVTWWWFVAALTFSIILGFGSLYLIYGLARILALLVLGISIANALAPLVNWLEARVRFPRPVGIGIVYLLLILLFAGILWMTVPVFIAQIQALVKDLAVWAPQVSGFLARFGLDSQAISGSFSSLATLLGSLVLSLPSAIFNSVLDFVLVIFVSLYWLILMNGTMRFFLSFYPRSRRKQVHSILSLMGNSMGGYLRGSAIDGLIFAVTKYIGLIIIGVPYALTLAVFAFIMEFFPTIGSLLSALSATLVALTISPTMGLITLIFTIILQQLENHILVPVVMHSQTTISPLLAVLAIVAGGAIGGLLGALVGIPVVSAVDVLVRDVIAPALREENGAEDEDEPEGEGDDT